MSSQTSEVKITKLGTDIPSSPKPAPKRKTMRTFPRGVLKVKGVKDPAKPPPLKKSARSHTIKLMTDIGTRKYRKTVRKRLSKMSPEKVKLLADKHGLLKNKNTPPALMRDMVEGGVIAGFISLD
jgi:hypothetical protein